jgi:hypothetical protein
MTSIPAENLVSNQLKMNTFNPHVMNHGTKDAIVEMTRGMIRCWITNETGNKSANFRVFLLFQI